MVGAYWRHGRDGSTQWRINLMRRNGPASDMRSRVSLMCPATMLVKAIDRIPHRQRYQFH